MHVARHLHILCGTFGHKRTVATQYLEEPGSINNTKPEAEDRGKIDAEVQSGIDDRLVAEGRVKAWKKWKSVEDLSVVFVANSGSRLYPVKRHSHKVILNRTEKMRIIQEPVHSSLLPV
jgi:hypothetical protein